MKNKILIIISFLAGAFLFNSCLKDKFGEDWTASLKGKMYAQIVNPGKQSSTITPASTDQIIRVFVNIATDALPTSDITVNVAIDAAALTAYNAKNSTSLVLCPNVTITNVTIKAGTRNGYAYITLKNANLLDLKTPYAIPISITGVSDPKVIIASNFKTEILQVPIANRWEGKYKMVTGSTFQDVLNTGFTLNFPCNFALETSGVTTVIVHDLSLSSAGGYGRLVWNGSSGTYYGSFCAEYDIDPVTNKVIAVRNTYGQPASNTRSAILDPSGVNKYDPITKTFDVSYFCIQPSTVSGPRLKFRDILQYSGSL